jgi:hypothetical protein
MAPARDTTRTLFPTDRRHPRSCPEPLRHPRGTCLPGLPLPVCQTTLEVTVLSHGNLGVPELVTDLARAHLRVVQEARTRLTQHVAHQPLQFRHTPAPGVESIIFSHTGSRPGSSRALSTLPDHAAGHAVTSPALHSVTTHVGASNNIAPRGLTPPMLAITLVDTRPVRPVLLMLRRPHEVEPLKESSRQVVAS